MNFVFFVCVQFLVLVVVLVLEIINSCLVLWSERPMHAGSSTEIGIMKSSLNLKNENFVSSFVLYS